jgi:predicted PurR-regulated permease PerM
MKSERIILLAMAAALGLGCFLILLPFIPAMLWAAILVYCTWPGYQRACAYVRPSVAALLITLLVAAIVLVPVVHVGLVAAKEARESQLWVHSAMLNGLPPAPEFFSKIPLIGCSRCWARWPIPGCAFC